MRAWNIDIIILGAHSLARLIIMMHSMIHCLIFIETSGIISENIVV